MTERASLLSRAPDTSPSAVAVAADGSSIVVSVRTAFSSNPTVDWTVQVSFLDPTGHELSALELDRGALNAHAAALATSGFVVIWEKGGYGANRLQARLLDASGAPRGAQFSVSDSGDGQTLEYFARVAPADDGSFAAVWSHEPLVTQPNGTEGKKEFRFRRFSADGAALGPSRALTPLVSVVTADNGGSSDLAALPDGGWCFAWPQQNGNDNYDVSIDSRRLEASGNAAGPDLLMSAAGNGILPFDPRVVAFPDGACAVVWGQYSLNDPGPSLPRLRRRLADDTLDPERTLPVGQPFAPFGLASDGLGNMVLAWSDSLGVKRLQAIDQNGVSVSAATELSDTDGHGLFRVGMSTTGRTVLAWYGTYEAFAQGFVTDCIAGNGVACVSPDQRFDIRATFRDRQGVEHPASAVRLSTDTVGLAFFSAANLELIVKLLDGRPVNGHFWVFLGGLTDLATTVTVTDRETGAVKIYRNPAGKLAARADAAAFADEEPAPARTAAPTPDLALAEPEPLVLASRFTVRVVWRNGTPHPATPRHGFANQAAYFSFFSPDNIELAVKILDGRAVNGHYWVFIASLTDVDYSVTVTDNLTHAERVYVNPHGLLQSRADTAAF